eukprot:4845159-Amphidinium_carterae.1
MQANKKVLRHGKSMLSNTSRNREQGLRANYKLCYRGSLLEILKGVLKLLELREILRYEHASGEGVSDALRIGIVLRQLEETKLKEYLLMNASKLTAWKDFKAE